MLVHMLATLVLYVVSLVALVGGLAYFFWETVESRLLKFMFQERVSKEYGTSVTVKALRVRKRGVFFEELTVGNDPTGVGYAAPYFARVGVIEIHTSGVLGLLSLGGLLKFDKFVFGFPVRQVEELIVRDMFVIVEEQNGVANNAFLAKHEARQKAEKKRRAAREVKVVRDFQNKWRATSFEPDADKSSHHGVDENSAEVKKKTSSIFLSSSKKTEGDHTTTRKKTLEEEVTCIHSDDEDHDDEEEIDDSIASRLKKVSDVLRKPGTSFAERRDHLSQLREHFHRQDKDSRAAAKLAATQTRDKSAERWQIGHISVSNVSLDIKKQTYRLDKFDYRGFVGDSAKLKRKMLYGIMPDLIADSAMSAIAARVDTVRSMARTSFFHHSSS